jgi:hypothetical protein
MQQVLPETVCDMAMQRPRHGDAFGIVFPSCIANMPLELLRNLLEGKTGPHICWKSITDGYPAASAILRSRTESRHSLLH